MQILNRHKKLRKVKSRGEVPIRVAVPDGGENAPARPQDGQNEFLPETILAAVTKEEPLPLLVAEMSAWSIGASTALLSLGFLAFLASPLFRTEKIAAGR
jgi:hypothetical protein